jgi:predicted permease
MGLWSKLIRTLRPASTEIDEELAFHVAMREHEYREEGMSASDARSAARRKFGSVVKAGQEARDAHTWAWLDALRRDSIYSIRGLMRRPVLLATGILTLAIGIGLNLAIFAYVDTLLLRPLPLPGGERVMAVLESRNGERTGGNPLRMGDYQAGMQTLEAVGGIYTERVVEAGPDGPTGIRVLRTAGDVHGALGFRTVAGRGFTHSEKDGSAALALVSQPFANRRFGSPRSAVGQVLQTRSGAFTIIGVLSPEASTIEEFDLCVPIGMQDQPRTAGYLLVIARLKSGVALETANAEMAAVVDAMRAAHPVTDKGLSARITPLMDFLNAEARLPILFLFGVVASILLIACANLSGLLLARSAERVREAAIRISVGASRGDLIRLFLAEALWLAIPGGLLSLLAGTWAVAGLRAASPLDTPLQTAVAIDARAMGFALLLTLLCTLLVGLLPAWQATRLAAYGATSSAGRSRLRASLVVGQVAVSLVLLSSAVLFLNALTAARKRPCGFESTQVIAMRFDFPWDTAMPKLNNFYTGVLAAMREMPGVRTVGLVDNVPLHGGSQGRNYVRIQGRLLDESLTRRSYAYRAVTPGYFEALRIPLLQGRWFREGPVKEVVLNENMARRYFGDASPVGSMISFTEAGKEPVWFEVAGVCGNVTRAAFDEPEGPEVFIDIRKTYWPQAYLVARVEGDPRTTIAMAKQRIARVDPYAPIRIAATLEGTMDSVWKEPDLMATLLTMLAGMALVLVSMGIFGMLAGFVRARTREFGVRLALGATPESLVRLSLAHGCRLGLLGIVLGGLLTAPVVQAISRLIPGGRLDDWGAYALSIVTLLGVCAPASLVPARRAAKLDPVEVLRHD